ncbi:hypothetical protein SSX86_010682 [Deinandra increscens subsp. villosa]|uniref:F-box domain-containing protein n=1 Tax=Deinandra increscens subsp. villosa TaxID=3103831 RepID=A0AAP0DCH9_9ASTR
MATTLPDIHPDIIRQHLLSKLDGRSLSSAATASSDLHALCSDNTLWADISKSTWPSITHPRVNRLISTFPARHRSFFQDSFPDLFTDVTRHRSYSSTSKQPVGATSCHHLANSPHLTSSDPFISAVDIRYQNEIVFSKVLFTDVTIDFLSSALRVEVNDDPTRNQSGSEQSPGISRPIDLKVDELAGPDEPTLSHLRESVTLSWILIDPTRKRACNLSSVKSVGVRQDWMSNETVLRYVTVLPGVDPNEMVECKIEVVLGVSSAGLHVKHVVLKLMNLNRTCLNGREFLVVIKGAVLEENNVRRKVMDDEKRWRGYMELKELKREKKERERMEEEKRELALKMNYIIILCCFAVGFFF